MFLRPMYRAMRLTSDQLWIVHHKNTTHTTETRYTLDHEFATRHSDGEVTVGIAPYAMKQLGEFVFVQLPDRGRRVAKGDSTAEVESVKTYAEVYSPVSGRVTDINEALEEQPKMANLGMPQDAWFFRLGGVDPEEFSSLLPETAYWEHLAKLGREAQ